MSDVTYTVMTDADLSGQKLYKSGDNTIGRVVAEMGRPVDTLDLAGKIDEPGPVLLGYDDVVVTGRTDGNFPVVTIPHYVLAKALKEQGVAPDVHADLGCGSGFLGNYAAKKLGARHVKFGDLNPGALNEALSAYLINNRMGLEEARANLEAMPNGMRLQDGGRTIDLLAGDVRGTMQGADTMTACPLYVPGVCEVFPQAYSVFGMTAKQNGAPLYVAHSNLASPVVEDAASKLQMSLTDIARVEHPLTEFRTDSRRAPIHREGLNPEVVEKLRTLGLRVKDDGEFSPRAYFHDIIVSKME